MSRRGERTSPPGPASVRLVVARVRLVLRCTRALESLLVGLAAALILCAAAASSRLALDAATGLAVLCGLCAAASWWIEHPVASERTARKLDRCLCQGGALATAYDLEGRARALAPLEQLVQARVLARLRVVEAVRALFPPLFVPVAAPAAAALLLFFVHEARPADESVALDYAVLASGLERALFLGSSAAEPGAPGDEAGARVRDQAQALFSALHRRATLAHPAEALRDRALVAQLDALDAELAQLHARLERDSELFARIEAARPWLDALRAGLAAEAGTDSGGQAGSSGTAQGTMGGSSLAGVSSTSAPNPSIASEPGPAPGLGTQAGTWWPAEYDGLVARWVELSRAERSP